MLKLPAVIECPSCGKQSMHRKRKNLTREYHGTSFLVQDLEFHECSSCGERLFTPDAVRKIKASAPLLPGRRKRAA
ncbi:MAG: YgiT-type zinc finger protein [Candidatus Sumerlaeaceae bacterium]